MKKSALDKLAFKYWTDKNSSHHDYCRKYEKYLPFGRNENIKILEIGVLQGNSLKVWSEYYKNSTVVGVDCDVNCKQYEDKDRIFVEIGSQNDVEFLTNISNKYGPFDFILDDCSHVQNLTIESFEILFPLLKDGGIYVIEDTCCSYWHSHGGGYKKEGTSIEYFKNMVDDVNFRGNFLEKQYSDFYHIRRDDLHIKQVKDKKLDIRTDIESITFLNSIIMMHKRN